MGKLNKFIRDYLKVTNNSINNRKKVNKLFEETKDLEELYLGFSLD